VTGGEQERSDGGSEQVRSVMPMKMGIHCKPIGHSHSASLDSRVRGNDGGMVFAEIT